MLLGDGSHECTYDEIVQSDPSLFLLLFGALILWPKHN